MVFPSTPVLPSAKAAPFRQKMQRISCNVVAFLRMSVLLIITSLRIFFFANAVRNQRAQRR